VRVWRALAIQICQFPVDAAASLVAPGCLPVAEKRTRKKQDEAAATGAHRRGRKGRKRIRIFANHSSRHLRVGKSPSPLKSEEVERFIESWDAQSLEDTPGSASETSPVPPARPSSPDGGRWAGVLYLPLVAETEGRTRESAQRERATSTCVAKARRNSVREREFRPPAPLCPELIPLPPSPSPLDRE